MLRFNLMQTFTFTMSLNRGIVKHYSIWNAYRYVRMTVHMNAVTGCSSPDLALSHTRGVWRESVFLWAHFLATLSDPRG
jgi:hypothetical protein